MTQTQYWSDGRRRPGFARHGVCVCTVYASCFLHLAILPSCTIPACFLPHAVRSRHVCAVHIARDGRLDGGLGWGCLAYLPSTRTSLGCSDSTPRCLFRSAETSIFFQFLYSSRYSRSLLPHMQVPWTPWGELLIPNRHLPGAELHGICPT